jgi:hypothetical protein
MSSRLPWDITATGADDEKMAAGTGAKFVRRLTVVLLLTAAALDLTRCCLVMTAARHPAPAAALVATGLAGAALTVRTARGCQVGQPWAGWTALLIGAASTPQAAASGFRGPYTIPDTATAALGLLLAITILATAGRMDHRTPGTWPAPGCEMLALLAHALGLERERGAGRRAQGRPGLRVGQRPDRGDAVVQREDRPDE